MTALSFAIGQRLTADLLTDFLALTPIVYTKASSTDRNTTTTYADDPELKDIPLAVGTYDIELIGFYTVASTTPKLKTQWHFTGTWNSPIRNCLGPGSTNIAAPDIVTPSTAQGYVADSQNATYNSSTSPSYSVFREVALNVTVTVAGNLSLQWAQSVSNGSNVSVKGGTSFRIRKLNV